MSEPRPEPLKGRDMFWLWAGVLLGPMMWAVSLSAMFSLTHPVCQGAPRGLLWLTGVACVAITLAALIGAAVGLARAGFPPERSGIAPFMLRLGVGASAIFALVILLSMAPIALLTPCPL